MYSVQAYVDLAAPVKKLNCLDDVLCFFVLVKSYHEKKKNGLIYITTDFFFLCKMFEKHLWNTFFLLYVVIEIRQPVKEIL